MMNPTSIIIPVIEHGDSLESLHQAYYDSLMAGGLKELEFIYVVAPAYSHKIAKLLEFQNLGQPITIIELNRDFGEAASIKIGAQQAQYDLILTLPSYEQVPAKSIPGIFNQLADNDALVVRRWPRIEKGFKRLQNNMLTKLLSLISSAPFGEIGSGVRLCRKQVFNEITLYGDFHRFLPMIAHEQGFQVKITDLPQSAVDSRKSLHPLRTYMGRLLDIITVIFLTKFNKRPLRFFGAIGSAALTIGFIGLAWIGAERLLLGIAAAGRPAMVLFLLFAVLGIQLLAIGLVGETLIFTHASDITEYKIRKIHESPEQAWNTSNPTQNITSHKT